ncbi:MAG TPA: hypothetical protein VNZ53_37270 [Steroidobacteraceae bacterium]|jgi:hypothetical protein|nr:hypothetical protein [Steroidobacteraceae bacterium]
MSIIGDVCKELLGMFLADARLTKAILFLVAIVAGLVVELRIERFPSWLSRDSHSSGPSRSHGTR